MHVNRPERGRVSPAPGSCFANVDAARRAVEMTLPMIAAAIVDREICGAGFLHIVVMDPALPPGRSDFDSAVLYEHAVGDRQRWDADYAVYARAKARLSWRLQRDTHAVAAQMPQALTDGESLLAGGVCIDGITVAVSGAEAAFDIAFASAIAVNLRALAAHALAKALAHGHTSASDALPHTA
jgi:hypothetical protein